MTEEVELVLEEQGVRVTTWEEGEWIAAEKFCHLGDCR